MKLVPPLVIPDDMLQEGLDTYREAVAECDAEL